jgi:hypothetical protein
MRRQALDGAEERLHGRGLTEQAVEHAPVVAGASERGLRVQDTSGGRVVAGSGSGVGHQGDLSGV